MILAEGDVLIPAYPEAEELWIPVSRITRTQVVVRGDQASVVQRVAREKCVRGRKGVINADLAVVVPDTRCTRIRVVVAAAGNTLVRKRELPNPRGCHDINRCSACSCRDHCPAARRMHSDSSCKPSP